LQGLITVDECQNVLNNFASGKTPGHDGIPIEFYKTFWSLLGEILVKAFNETFAPGICQKGDVHFPDSSYYYSN